jgi:hypothetical protein
MIKRLRDILREPLYRLLLINLATGLTVASFLFGGLLLINPAHLRDLILSDSSPGIASFLLLFGLAVTFGSAAMGTAIMAIGARRTPSSGAKPAPLQPAPIAATTTPRR